MSVQWTLVAGFLYAEILLISILLLPFVTADKWSKMFRSRFVQSLSKQAAWYFWFVLFVLVLLSLDAIREMRKYSNVEVHEHSHLDTEMQTSMKLYRAQRNFYISGFALFLSFITRRLILLISQQAVLKAQFEAAMKQATSATTVAEALMEEERPSDDATPDDTSEAGEEVDELEAKISEVEKALLHKDKEIEALKSQANSVTKEYDRLLEDYNKLTNEGKDPAADKKDE